MCLLSEAGPLRFVLDMYLVERRPGKVLTCLGINVENRRFNFGL